MTDPVLTYQDVRFAYDRKPVLDGFSLGLGPGEIVLLAAPNGAGKTTALWLAAGLLRPDAGTVRVFGRDPFVDREVLGEVGVLPEGAPLPGFWRGRDVLAFQRQTFPRWDESLCERLVRAFRLDLDVRVQALSRGQRGKLALVNVLCTRPGLLLLDEPTLGLDVATRRLFLSEILGHVAEAGCPILIASHEIAHAESIADRLVLQNGGKVRCDEPVDELLARHRILGWDAHVPEPPAALDWLDLPSMMGRRALAHSWNEELATAWLRMGGRAHAADLETIYLSLTGEVEHA